MDHGLWRHAPFNPVKTFQSHSELFFPPLWCRTWMTEDLWESTAPIFLLLSCQKYQQKVFLSAKIISLTSEAFLARQIIALTLKRLELLVTSFVLVLDWQAWVLRGRSLTNVGLPSIIVYAKGLWINFDVPLQTQKSINRHDEAFLNSFFLQHQFEIV